MKTLFKTKAALLILIAGLAFSCKKNETVPADNYTNEADTTQATVDTINSKSDTTKVNSAGTTGATGEGSTGSGSDGTTQKGNTSVRTDSTATTPKR